MKKMIINRFISAMTSLAIVLLVYNCFQDSIINTNSITSSTSNDTIVVSETESENPFNKQDDKEVRYDRSRWKQPLEWNCPTIDPRDYEGGIMLFFDKIGLEPEWARGKVQRVYFSIVGATEPVNTIKFHFFYDTRLTVKPNSKGEMINVGKGLSEFTTGSAMIEEGQLAFYAYSSNDVLLDRSSIFTVDFIVPENAEPGDLYPLGLAYVDDGIVADTFMNSQKDNAGKLQMTYVFTKGIYNGYIKIIGEKVTTTTTTTTTTTDEVPTFADHISYAELEANDGFYFSHDNGDTTGRGFSTDMVKSLRMYDVTYDGTVLERPVDRSLINFGGATPASVFRADSVTGRSIDEFKYKIPVYYGAEPLYGKDGTPCTVTAYIGIKGDSDLDGIVQMYDASSTLRYFTAMSSGKNPGETLLSDSKLVSGPTDIIDDFCAFLASVTSDEYDPDNWKTTKAYRVFRADDASAILRYYTRMSTLTARGDVTEDVKQAEWDAICPYRAKSKNRIMTGI